VPALTAPAPPGEKTARQDGAVGRCDDGSNETSEALGAIRAVPQPDDSMTQYSACRHASDPGTLAEAAARGSHCAR
jgi:hypothetical protein